MKAWPQRKKAGAKEKMEIEPFNRTSRQSGIDQDPPGRKISPDGCKENQRLAREKETPGSSFSSLYP